MLACPLAVSLELRNGSHYSGSSSSSGGSAAVPVVAPLPTSGLTGIKLQLTSPEVVTAVTVRLHKPRDSNTLGLSQVLVLGTLAFADQPPASGGELTSLEMATAARFLIGRINNELVLIYCFNHIIFLFICFLNYKLYKL